ncbi:unnamed protein product [Protopolystoma xenopodis]|uniref:Uncharacterized protein n=1 Tax=Protopolystoma xenopodis TaxID=117903 RepID=A0A3S5BCR5_9PLAT|nr:unnamed protein product [Protopolystoma xenopodis]
MPEPRPLPSGPSSAAAQWLAAAEARQPLSSHPLGAGLIGETSFDDEEVDVDVSRFGRAQLSSRPGSRARAGSQQETVATLTGDGRPGSGASQFLGLLDVCSVEREFVLHDRLLVQHQYGAAVPCSCAKVFRSAVPGRQLAWRFLAIRLPQDPFFQVTLCP